jgi:hypothetical protein
MAARCGWERESTRRWLGVRVERSLSRLRVGHEQAEDDREIWRAELPEGVARSSPEPRPEPRSAKRSADGAVLDSAADPAGACGARVCADSSCAVEGARQASASHASSLSLTGPEPILCWSVSGSQGEVLIANPRG